MKSKQEVIQEAYLNLIGKSNLNLIKDNIHEDGWCLMFDENDIKVTLTFKELGLSQIIIHSSTYVIRNIGGTLWRPKSLSGIENNNGWQETGYHHWRGVKLKKSPFENGEYYEIGFMGATDNSFHNQGVKQFNNGFFDEGNYPLKPFPTHFKPISKSANPLY